MVTSRISRASPAPTRPGASGATSWATSPSAAPAPSPAARRRNSIRRTSGTPFGGLPPLRFVQPSSRAQPDEAEIGVGHGAENGAQRLAVATVRPADLAAFELADVVGVDGRRSAEQPPMGRADCLRQLLLAQPTGPAGVGQQPVGPAAAGRGFGSGGSSHRFSHGASRSSSVFYGAVLTHGSVMVTIRRRRFTWVRFGNVHSCGSRRGGAVPDRSRIHRVACVRCADRRWVIPGTDRCARCRRVTAPDSDSPSGLPTARDRHGPTLGV